MTSSKILITGDSRMSRMMLTTIIKNFHPDWIIETADNADAALVLSATPITEAKIAEFIGYDELQ